MKKGWLIDMPVETIRTPENAARFLDALEESGNVREASDKAQVGRNSVYLWRRDDEQFRAAWDARIASYGDMLEAEAFRRAYHGVDKPVFQQGMQVGVIREYSDGLLARMLVRFKPEYSDKVEHSGPEGGPIQFMVTRAGKKEN